MTIPELSIPATVPQTQTESAPIGVGLKNQHSDAFPCSGKRCPKCNGRQNPLRIAQRWPSTIWGMGLQIIVPLNSGSSSNLTGSLFLSMDGRNVLSKACPDWHASALNFSFSHCMSLLNFLGEFSECFGKVDACHSEQTLSV
jgi:hypothetical protein